MGGLITQRFQRRNLRLCAGDQRRGAGDIELAAANQTSLGLGDFDGLLLNFHILMGNLNLLLIAAQLNVIPRDLGQERHQDIALVFDLRANIRVRRFDLRRTPPKTSISHEASKPA